MGHRKAILAALLAALPGLAGCFLDEIDKSMARYPGGRPAAESEPPPGGRQATAKPVKAPPGEAAAPAAPEGPSWWETATTLGSEPMDETIAGCRLGGRVEFMRRDDCLARGGTSD